MALGLGYLVAMTASMGLQQLKSWQDNKQSKELANKQLEMKEALQNREFERLRRLQREAHKIAMEMEKEAHFQRREDIEKEYDNAFESLANQAELDKWPLNVVPFIMKGESFGSHIRGFDVATVHCILTPSNDINFNRWIYSKLDMRVEELINSYWNSNTTHPIVYYGGSWKLKFPNGVPKFDYNDVTRLHSALNSIPVIAITPYFTPYGTFIMRLWCWGMGTEDESNQQSITPPIDLFTYEINTETEYCAKDTESEIEKKELIETTISELSSYFISMIGYLNDMYYWRMYQIPLHFPSLLSKEALVPERLLPALKKNYQQEARDSRILISNNILSNYNYIINQKAFLSKSDLSDLIYELIRKVDKIYPVVNVWDDYVVKFYLLIKECPLENVQLIGVEKINAYNEYVHEFGILQYDIDIFPKEYITKENHDSFNIIQYIEKFRSFISLYSERFEKLPALYIRKTNNVFRIHLIDVDTKKIICTKPSFSFEIYAKKIRKENNTNYIFRSPLGLICRYEKLDKLIDWINSNNLIF